MNLPEFRNAYVSLLCNNWTIKPVHFQPDWRKLGHTRPRLFNIVGQITHCPITAVATHRTKFRIEKQKSLALSPEMTFYAAKLLGLTRRNARLIMKCADLSPQKLSRTLGKRAVNFRRFLLNPAT